MIQSKAAADVADELTKPDASFFSRAGYQRFNEPTYASPVRRIGQNGHLELEPIPQRKLYYWAEVEAP